MNGQPVLKVSDPEGGGWQPQQVARGEQGWGSYWSIAFIVVLSLVCSIPAPSAWSEPTESLRVGPGLSFPLVLIQLGDRPNGSPPSQHPALFVRAGFGEGARILIVSAGGSGQDWNARVLAPGFHSAADPEVAFDGKRILFAGKPTASDPWNIYEANLADGTIRQITKGLGNCRSPRYQGSLFTISEKEPWYQITFVRTDPHALNEFGAEAATSLYSCKLDGSFVQRLTYNLSSDYDPVVFPDGRVVYASWQRATWDRGAMGRITLMGVNIDGVDLAAFCGDLGRRIKHMPCFTANGLAVFVEADEVPWDGSGMLSCVTIRRPLHSYRPITSPSDGLFHSPWGLPDGSLLVSHRPADGSGTHGVYRMDVDSKRLEKLFDDPRYHDIQARPLVPRAEPDGRSSALVVEKPTGKFYCLNVYQNDLQDRSWMPPGTAKKVRLLEGIPRQPLPGKSVPEAIGVPQLAARRILGEAPVAEDGSFSVEVPANTPIQLQLLDERGMALRSCGWIWTRNHIPQGCIGCHEDGELTPTNRVVKALMEEPALLCPPAEKRVTVDFRRDVMPIVLGKCVGCHGPGGSPPQLPAAGGTAQKSDPEALARTIYQILCAQEAESRPEALRWKYVDPGRARTSPLVWHVFGVNTSRPWDGPARKRPAKPIPPQASAQSEPLTAEEKGILVRWIDLGARWEGQPEPAAPAPSR